MTQLLARSNKEKTKLSQDDAGTLFFLAALIFGGWFRLYPAYLAGFPIGDGGLFYSMTQALQENGYRIPEFVQYNGLNIPFAYPPLGFYLSGLFSDVFGVELIEVFRFLPAIILILTIAAFYKLAIIILGTRYKAGIAALFYALLPKSITWLIMGGGITRSLGLLFLILAIQNIWLLFTQHSKKYLFLSIIFSALVCLSHPAMIIQTVGIAIFLFLFKGKNRQNFLRAILVAAGTLALTSPWWLTILTRFGMEPFLTASKTGFHDPFFWVSMSIYPFSEEPFMTLIIILAVIGIAVSIAQRKFLLPLMYFSPFLIEPRSAANVAIIPMALLASIALHDLIFPALTEIESKFKKAEHKIQYQNLSKKVLIAYIGIILLTSMQFYTLQTAGDRVTDENIQAYEWIKSNTPSDSQFMVITGNMNIFGDSTLEWFPTLTDRISLMTIQGGEWLDDKPFIEKFDDAKLLQSCVTSPSPRECIETQTNALELAYDYIYIARKTFRKEYTNIIIGDSLICDLREENNVYEEVYRSDNVSIFKYAHSD